MADKTYAKGFYVKEMSSEYGKFFSASINVIQFIDFLRANQNDKGYVNLTITKRREPSPHGDTHTAYLNDYKKSGSESDEMPF